MPPPEIGVPGVQAANPPCRSFDQSLLVKPATYRRHPTPCANLLRVSPEASPTSAHDLAYARPLARAGTLINCEGATDRAVPTPLSVRTFRESADLEKVVDICAPLRRSPGMRDCVGWPGLRDIGPVPVGCSLDPRRPRGRTGE